MLRLNLDNAPRWLDLGGGLRLLLRPFDLDLMAEAEEDESLIAARAAVDYDAPTDAQKRELGKAMAHAVARLAVLEWEGVGDADGKPLPSPFPAGIDALLKHPMVFARFQADYMQPGLVLAEEGNGSAPAPNGFSAGATTTAGHALRAAKPARSGKARR